MDLHSEESDVVVLEEETKTRFVVGTMFCAKNFPQQVLMTNSLQVVG